MERFVTFRTGLQVIVILSAIMIALPSLMAVVYATPVTEVERVKDEFYFRISGRRGNVQGTSYPHVEFVYKNLSPITQNPVLTIGGQSFSEVLAYIESGKEIGSGVIRIIGGDNVESGDAFYFVLTVDGSTVDGSIVVPPPA